MFDDLIPAKTEIYFDDLVPEQKAKARGFMGAAKDLALGIGGATLSAAWGRGSGGETDSTTTTLALASKATGCCLVLSLGVWTDDGASVTDSAFTGEKWAATDS